MVREQRANEANLHLRALWGDYRLDELKRRGDEHAGHGSVDGRDESGYN